MVARLRVGNFIQSRIQALDRALAFRGSKRKTDSRVLKLWIADRERAQSGTRKQQIDKRNHIALGSTILLISQLSSPPGRGQG
jgi:hypothetical protein